MSIKLTSWKTQAEIGGYHYSRASRRWMGAWNGLIWLTIGTGDGLLNAVMHLQVP